MEIKKFCPHYLIKDHQIMVTQVDGETTVTKVENIYDKLECNEFCALYEFRPKCLIGGK